MDNSKQFYYKDNRLSQIRGFYYTVQSGNVISEAAKVLGLSQSTVSLQIQTLERDLKVSLFNRDDRPYSLTDAGRKFYQKIVPLYQKFSGIYEEFIEENQQEQANKIIITSNHRCILYMLPPIIKRFQEICPDVQLVIENTARDEALERLKKGAVHLAIFPFKTVPPECSYIPIASHNPILIINKAHVLAQKEEVTLEDVSAYQFIRIDPGLITFPSFEETLKRYKLESHITFQNADWEILKKFVEANAAIAIISDMCFGEHDHDKLAVRSLTQYFPKMEYGAFIKQGAYMFPAFERLIEVIKESING